MKKITLFIFLFVLGFYSCKKETTADYPTVTISSPYNQQTFNVFDNITIQAHISEGQTLTSIQVYVANSTNTPVLPTVTVPVTSNTMDINLSYAINDIHLNGGAYYVVVAASNGTNQTTAFRQITITAVPEKRTAIYAITRNSSGLNAWKIDSVFHSSASITVAGDYSSSSVSSYYQQLYIAGYDSGSASAYSLPLGTLAWSIAGIISPTPYFTNVYSYNNTEYISYYSGSIKNFDYHGNLLQTYTTLYDYYPQQTLIWNGYLIADEGYVGSSIEAELTTFYQSSGTLYQFTNLPGPLVSMFGFDNSHIMVFGNANTGSPYAEQYNIAGNIFYTPMTFPSARLLSVAQIDTNNYLLGFDNSTIYHYSYNPANLLPFINGINASCLRYDNLNNEVLVSSGNKVLDYNYSSGSLMNSTTLADSVMNIMILYNK